MPKSPGSGTREFQLRPGVAPFGPAGWRGVNTESDPGSLDPNELQRADNVRIRGKNIVTRGGISLFIDLGLGPTGGQNYITWMREAPADNPRVRLWISALGAASCGSGDGSSIHHYDATELPAFQTYSYTQASANYQAPIAKYSGRLYQGDRTLLREVVTITSPPYIAAENIMSTPPSSPIAIFDGYAIRCMLEFDSKLFIGLENLAAPASSKIVVWNGLSAKDDLTGIRPPLSMGRFQDKLVVGFDATAGNIQVRGAGAAPGTWTPFALAGFRSCPFGNVMQEYRQYLYIAGGNDNLYRFDGAALTVARNIAAADTVDGFGITAVAAKRGTLYYGWNAPGATYLSRIGRHDPESTALNEWTDTYRDITTAWASFKQLSALATYDDTLVFGGFGLKIGATAHENIVQGNPAQIQPTIPTAGSGSSGVRQLLRFP